MTVIRSIFRHIKKETRNGHFCDSWFIEGTEAELEEFNRMARTRLRRNIKAFRYDCIRVFRWPTEYPVLQLGKPYRDCTKCYLLTIETGFHRSNPFGSMHGGKKG